MTPNLSLRIILLIFISSQMIFSSSFKLISDIGTSAEMIEGNIEGFSHDAHVIFENPASLSLTKPKSASFFTTTFFDESTFNSLSFSSSFWKGI